MSEIPCIYCLKYPICASKDELDCRDLVIWLNEYYTDIDKRANRLIEFEKWWGREVSIITQGSLKLYFKKKKDHHQCLIAKRM